MLAIPTSGFARSVKKHNIDHDVLRDWIEGSILFIDEYDFLSQNYIVDTLIDNERYSDQQFALEGVANIWYELRMGTEWIGEQGATAVERQRIIRRGHWQQHLAQSFFLLVSLASHYDWWTHEFGNDYTEQGELFELLVKASFETQFAHWAVYQTGWTKTQTLNFRQIVEEIVRRLGEKIGDFELWDQPHAKERGVDLLCYRAFPDGHVGIPIYMMQCASGKTTWRAKMSTPDLNIWRNVINFGSKPIKAFAMPFAISNDEFARSSVTVGGLLLDRYRLLGASQFNERWIPDELETRLIAWLEPRIGKLLELSEL